MRCRVIRNPVGKDAERPRPVAAKPTKNLWRKALAEAGASHRTAFRDLQGRRNDR
jgi:hypothetical protein